MPKEFDILLNKHSLEEILYYKTIKSLKSNP